MLTSLSKRLSDFIIFLHSSIKEFKKTVHGYFVPWQNKPIRNNRQSDILVTV